MKSVKYGTHYVDMNELISSESFYKIVFSVLFYYKKQGIDVGDIGDSLEDFIERIKSTNSWILQINPSNFTIRDLDVIIKHFSLYINEDKNFYDTFILTFCKFHVNNNEFYEFTDNLSKTIKSQQLFAVKNKFLNAMIYPLTNVGDANIYSQGLYPIVYKENNLFNEVFGFCNDKIHDLFLPSKSLKKNVEDNVVIETKKWWQFWK